MNLLTRFTGLRNGPSSEDALVSESDESELLLLTSKASPLPNGRPIAPSSTFTSKLTNLSSGGAPRLGSTWTEVHLGQRHRHG